MGVSSPINSLEPSAGTLASRTDSGQLIPFKSDRVELFNRTILAGFRAFVADHQRYWHEYANALAYAYNTQVRRTTGERHFDLIMCRPPESVALDIGLIPEDPLPPRLENKRFMETLAA